jgi:hypothetical protein
MKKRTSHVRLFVALAALGMGGLSTACTQVNPANPSHLPGADIVTPAEEVPLSELENLPVIEVGVARKIR